MPSHVALDRLGWVSTMPAEWQARQLSVIAWAFAPGKATSLAGSSTETDFSTNVRGALGEAGAAADNPGRAGRAHVGQTHSPRGEAAQPPGPQGQPLRYSTPPPR